MIIGLNLGEPTAPFCVVSVTGEIEIASAPDLDRTLEQLVGEGRVHIVLDLSGVTFLDSTGLAVLVKCLKRVGVLEGQIRLVVATRAVRQVLGITGLDTVFAIHDSLEAALA